MDGGHRPAGMMMTLITCFVCQMGLGFGYIYGVTMKHIVAEFEWSRTAFAAASAPLLLTMAAASPFVGAATERFGAKSVLSSASILLGLSLFLFSRMESLLEFYATSALFGLALTGLGDVAVGSVAARWVRGHRGLVLALVFVGSNAGGAIVPVAAEALASGHSWRWALQVLAVAVVVLVLPFAWFGVREPPSFLEPAHHEPRSANPRAGAPSLGLGEALRTRTFWILAFMLFAFYLYYLAVNQHLVAYLSDRGLSDARAAASLSFAVALGIGSKLAIGGLADRIPVKAALIANFSLMTAGSVLLLLGPSGALLPAFLVIHGATTAAENVLLPLVVVECFGLAHMARIYGSLMVVLLPGGVLGPILAGLSLDRLGSYQPAFLAFAALNLVAVAALLAIRPEGRLDAS